ncbi:MAG: aminopeptidase [Clostridiales bacterium]|jgi:aminopeptidase|nr:aminopeptidase [Clostridiales bacterium]
MNQGILRNYADLFVQSGGNVQKGQVVVINADLEAAEFARLVQESAYDAGASDVAILWRDAASTRVRYLRAVDEVFDDFPDWMVDRFKYFDDKGAVYLHIISDDPDLLNGVDTDRLRRFNKISREKTKEHQALTMSNKLRWTICAVPSPAWAKKVFPDLPEEEAVKSLWELFIKASRADGENPVEDWKIHRASFVAHVDYLNKQQFDKLRFKNSLGTDLTLGMPKNHIWKGGGSVDKDGIAFHPNIPTEEIYSAPDRARAEGRVVASMPLSYQGSLIDGIDLTFKNGEVVEFKASSNQAVLANIIEMDEGSRRLGEVALVPISSPINKMKTLFFNTLYDENASCHLALGKGYPNSIVGGADLSADELIERGVNHSLLHVDFMFGTEDMSIVGIYEDGREVVIFENGEYVTNY